jgi:hypothetical protein
VSSTAEATPIRAREHIVNDAYPFVKKNVDFFDNSQAEAARLAAELAAIEPRNAA